MKTQFRYVVYGDISNRMLAKTVDIYVARHIALFFMEERIRIEGIKTDEIEIIDNPRVESLLPLLAQQGGDAN